MVTPTSSGQETTGPGRPSSGDSRQALNRSIGALVRETRADRGLSQFDVGKWIKVTRSVISRIEDGSQELSADRAEVIAGALDLPELVELVNRRDHPTPGDNARDVMIPRMLTTQSPQGIRVVLADDFNLYLHLHEQVDDDARLTCDAIEVVVPTVERGRQLFGEHSVMYGRIEYQLKRLLDLKKSDFYKPGSLRIYESDDVIASTVVVTAAGGVEAAWWAPMPERHKRREINAGTLPVGVTTDSAAIAQLNSHIDGLVDGHETVKSNEALCLVDPRQADPMPVFARYFTVGEDKEDDIADREGAAVALILLVRQGVRPGHGIGRRVVTYSRQHSRKDKRRSLFSNTVEEVDIQRARTALSHEAVDEHRSTRTAFDATLDTSTFLSDHGGVVPASAFQFAAAREMAMFGLEIDHRRFVSIPLPTELRLIDKSKAAIAPQLFVLELRTDEQAPELDRLRKESEVDEVGVLDLEEDQNLNDFLSGAKRNNFLNELLTRYDIASR